MQSHNTKLTERWLRQATENGGIFKLSKRILLALQEVWSASSAYRCCINSWAREVAICSTGIFGNKSPDTDKEGDTCKCRWTQASHIALTASNQCSQWMNWSYTSCTFVDTNRHILKWRSSGPRAMRASFLKWCEMTAGNPFRAVIHAHQFQALWIYMGSPSCSMLR